MTGGGTSRGVDTLLWLVNDAHVLQILACDWRVSASDPGCRGVFFTVLRIVFCGEVLAVWGWGDRTKEKVRGREVTWLEHCAVLDFSATFNHQLTLYSPVSSHSNSISAPVPPHFTGAFPIWGPSRSSQISVHLRVWLARLKEVLVIARPL